MRKFFLKIGIFISPFIIVTVAMIFLVLIPEQSYILSIIDKNKVLLNAENPKIVLAGGSNLAFGIDSAMIQNTFHIPVVNMGVHAGFGLGRIFDGISPFLHRGDTLLIIPEYEQFIHMWDGSEAAYNLIFDTRQYRLLLSPRYGPPRDFTGYLKSQFQAIITRYQHLSPDPRAYLRDGFNEYGDYVKHLTKENQSFTPHKSSDPLNPAYLASFFKFIDFYTKQGITVVLSYPGFEEQSYRNSAMVIQELDAIFRKKENLLVISRPELYCFPTGLFYDTPYHLNAEGRNLRTRQLVEDLLHSLPGQQY